MATSSSSWMKRASFAVLSLVLLALGLWWVTEPNRRRAILFEAPVRVTKGATVNGSFEGLHEGPYVIQLRFPGYGRLPSSQDPHDESGAALAPLAKAVGGGWFGVDAPPGFKASYVIRRGTDIVAGGETGERLTGFFGPTESGVSIAPWIAEDLRGPHEVVVVFGEAVPELAPFDGRVTVGPGGDYISYASVEAFVRGVLLGAICFVAGVVALWVSLRRRRRAATHGATSIG